MKYLSAFCLALFLVSPGHAGQSVVYGHDFIYDETFPTTATNRVEICVHDWGSGTTHLLTGPGGAFGNGGTGWSLYFQNIGSEVLQVSNGWDNGAGTSINLGGLTVNQMYLRVQHDPANMVDDYEAWDIYGNRFFSASLPYTSETDSGIGFLIGFGNEPNASIAFFRVQSTIVPLNSRPPVTYDLSNRLLEWKFDGNYLDATGNGYTANPGGGTVSFTATPNQSPPVAVMKALPLTWTNVTTLRAGYPNTLDASSSYSELDSTSSVSYFWQQLSGPTNVTFTGRTLSSPTVSGLTWGDYVLQLTVIDASGTVSTTSGDVGAVAQDSNSVVVNANPAMDALLGHQITYGKNPWGYADYWNDHAMQLRASDYASFGWAPNGPQWEQTGAGTVSYWWGGVGVSPGNTSSGTIITADISSFTLTIPVQEAAKLDLSELPTRIILGSGGTEEVRVCSTTALSGTANLTACYDGRGQNAQSWGNSTKVLQAKVSGSGTDFINDPNAAVCPLGAPSPPGTALTTAGSVTMLKGSTAVVGVGTDFILGNANPSYYMRVAATHNGGTPFYFITQISVLNSSTSITLNRPYPADADNGTFSYAILNAQRTIDLRAHHIVDTTAIGEWMWGTTGCESATSVYLNPVNPVGSNSFAYGHDVPGNNGLLQSGFKYSITDTSGWINNSGTGGINFYAESLASYALCLRSGLTAACNAANVIDTYLIKSPWGNQDGNGFAPLITGGPAIAAIISAVGGRGASWGDIRSYANYGFGTAINLYNSGSPLCSGGDTRDNGYAFAWTILSALYDPDPTWRAEWISALPYIQAIDAACQGTDHSWANGFLWNNVGSLTFGPVTLSTGSATVSGTGLDPTRCTGVASGTGNIGLSTSTIFSTSGAFPSNSSADSLVVDGTSGGQQFSMDLLYSQGPGSSATLAAVWGGDSGTVTWTAINTNNAANNMQVYATSNLDTADLKRNYVCTYVNSTTLTLDRPWQGATGSSYYAFFGNLAGFGQQAYMLGIYTYEMGQIAFSTVTALGSYPATYKGYVNGAGGWISTTGFDTPTLTTNYGRGYQFCEPSTASSPLAFNWRSPSCSYSASFNDSMSVGREQNMEINNAISDYYILNPSTTTLTWGDKAYGAVWGNAAYNTGGVYVDAASDATNQAPTNLSDTSIHQGKWYGFFAGMAMLHRWPAERLGGVTAAIQRNVTIAFHMPANATSANIIVTAPSSAQTQTSCSSSPCAVQMDARQGAHLVTIQYLNGGGSVVSQTDPFIQGVN